MLLRCDTGRSLWMGGGSATAGLESHANNLIIQQSNLMSVTWPVCYLRTRWPDCYLRTKTKARPLQSQGQTCSWPRPDHVNAKARPVQDQGHSYSTEHKPKKWYLGLCVIFNSDRNDFVTNSASTLIETHQNRAAEAETNVVNPQTHLLAHTKARHLWGQGQSQG